MNLSYNQLKGKRIVVSSKTAGRACDIAAVSLLNKLENYADSFNIQLHVILEILDYFLASWLNSVLKCYTWE